MMNASNISPSKDLFLITLHSIDFCLQCLALNIFQLTQTSIYYTYHLPIYVCFRSWIKTIVIFFFRFPLTYLSNPFVIFFVFFIWFSHSIYYKKKKWIVHENHLKNQIRVVTFGIPMNRLVQIWMVEAAVTPRINQTSVPPAFLIKTLLPIRLAKVRQMHWIRKLQSLRRQIATPTPHLTTKIAWNHRWMPAMLMYSEIIVKIRQKVALGAVYHATKPIHHPMVCYAKVAFIIGGIELFGHFIKYPSHHLILFTNAHSLTWKFIEIDHTLSCVHHSFLVKKNKMHKLARSKSFAKFSKKKTYSYTFKIGIVITCALWIQMGFVILMKTKLK